MPNDLILNLMISQQSVIMVLVAATCPQMTVVHVVIVEALPGPLRPCQVLVTVQCPGGIEVG